VTVTGKARASTRDATAKRRPLARSRDADPESPDVLRGYYSQMVLIHSFELRTAEMYAKARIGGYCHLNLGEEATVVGFLDAPVRRVAAAKVRCPTPSPSSQRHFPTPEC
jgi:pyruvate dehydrogenase E1 component alpha subunit